MLEEYRRRRDELVEALEKELPKANYYKPRAGIFVYVNLKDYS
jgi:DNA-binding transcriptional MocR family regulator